MKIAYTMVQGKGDTDLMLFRLAEKLATEGYHTSGTVQINTEREGCACDMDVMVLPKGPSLRISQDLGKASKGCRLDPAALEAAVGMVASCIGPQLDILIINKFGKHEAEGRGFRSVIADAIACDVPVLVGVNSINLEAFHRFAGVEVTMLEPSEGSLLAWVRKASGRCEKEPDCTF